MSLADSDRELVVEELRREPTPAEAALFENLWSEHCAYRSSRPLLSAFESEGEQVVIGPGDDAAVVALPDADDAGEDERTYITMGIESHNHPSYVDPFDGAATGVGGIVRDTLSMGAYPIALADSLYFGEFDREHSKYLFEGVVEGISHYGNCIGVPTVAGSVDFHPDYEGNPLVNVACVGLTNEERLVTAVAQEPGNKLVLVGNATGRDGLGGASFASEDLAEDAETEDRPAVQVGDPYAEKLLIEANEVLIEENLVESARDLGAAGLGGASSELVAKGGLGAHIELERVHQREPNMSALEILLAESQERMCYEVAPENVERVEEIAAKYDLGCSVIGEVTEENYTCTFEGETVVDVDASFLGEGAPMNDLPADDPDQPETDLPQADLEEAFETIVSSPNTASKRWVYRQYDHEVGVRTSVGPGDDAAIVAVREAGQGLAISSGAAPNWTDVAPYEGARAVALENAMNVAAKGATPLAAVDCLNGGNPEKPEVYGGFKGIVDGLADMCQTLGAPVVGGNVSLYNDSPSGPIPPTPTLALVGTKDGYDAPPLALEADPESELLLVGDVGLENGDIRLGGSEYLARFDGSDRFPTLPDDPAALVDAVAAIADDDSTLATHDVSHGGLAVSLAEMVTAEAGLEVSIPVPESADAGPAGVLFHEQPGRVLIQTTDADAVRETFDGVAPVVSLGTPTTDGKITIEAGTETITDDAETIRERRSVIEAELA
ncbi:phosphoribosylformylglycinamidine synthase subunit PurL [Natrarchaeobaculum sulfurireducens]|uniref:Phosphoribosylformylglycinamidine synthase subunit PurL n=1 Tax=Natrarchaeobaculum sulfurireducens TaxID=2044521 RepID=A0A346PQR4_9EURY|nr:phosphoribosylformylglycinamidine synthase subunit PurL [Natrarchaeobaculum sulfurireducens]AXR78152.1 Phosphoribosylformylglycinamidine (FGAM) synthase, synthetase domain [Natrarchaeobaculum sulfurireducens]AXR81859.1 Phosphoribosylformylglycinamidine synthase, synthetase subunit [Natrarchaeobaculum sulfurireducens]